MKHRTNNIFRSLSYLKTYWHLVSAAYAVMLLSNAAEIAIPRVMQRIVDDGIRAGVIHAILNGIIVLMALAVGKGICTFISGVATEKASQGVAYDIRNRFHEKLHSMSFSFHDESETGQLLSRSIGDVERIRFLTGRAILQLVQMGTLIIGVLISMFQLNARLTLAAVSFVPALAVSAWWFGNRLRPLALLVRQREAILTSKLEQNLRGSRIVKAFAREMAETRKFREQNSAFLESQLKSAKLRSFFMPLTQFIAQAGIFIILIYGGKLAINGQLTLGELVAFTTYVSQLLVPVRRFGWILTSLTQASAAAERIFEILDLKSDVQESPGAKKLRHVDGRITFENVSLSYSRGKKVLDSISFVIEPGEKVALLGGTGSGKSSIINLLPRFYDPQSGRILVDGHDLRDLTLKSLRTHIGIVLQDTTLFASSIQENIAFGRPGASMEDIIRAAKAARIHQFIEELPEGYDSYVGERGVSLSGGQKQRLSIARAILKDPEILILDDATSSVDTETEQQIQEALEKLTQGKTAIIIAQRLSTVRKADKIFVLSHGRIAAVGIRKNGKSPHDQLLKTSGLYADIFYRQLRSDMREETE